jgi:hypothetical protein
MPAPNSRRLLGSGVLTLTSSSAEKSAVFWIPIVRVSNPVAVTVNA